MRYLEYIALCDIAVDYCMRYRMRYRIVRYAISSMRYLQDIACDIAYDIV